jgi:hypothetical protein
VPTGPDDAPFLLKVRWLLEALFHPLRAAPWHVAEGDAWGHTRCGFLVRNSVPLMNTLYC